MGPEEALEVVPEAHVPLRLCASGRHEHAFRSCLYEIGILISVEGGQGAQLSYVVSWSMSRWRELQRFASEVCLHIEERHAMDRIPSSPKTGASVITLLWLKTFIS